MRWISEVEVHTLLVVLKAPGVNNRVDYKIEQLDREIIIRENSEAVGNEARIWEDPVTCEHGHYSEVRDDGHHENRHQQQQNSRQPLLSLGDRHSSITHRFWREFRLVFGVPNDREVHNDQNEDQNENGRKQYELQVFHVRHLKNAHQASKNGRHKPACGDENTNPAFCDEALRLEWMHHDDKPFARHEENGEYRTQDCRPEDAHDYGAVSKSEGTGDAPREEIRDG